jgi:hypothetical protein
LASPKPTLKKRGSFEPNGIGNVELEDWLPTEYSLVFDRFGMFLQLRVARAGRRVYRKLHFCFPLFISAYRSENVTRVYMWVWSDPTVAMRPIPHRKPRGEDTETRVRPTSRRTSEEPEDDETWLAVQEF